jgi:hypothetical protein
MMVAALAPLAGCGHPRRTIAVRHEYRTPETGYWLFVMTSSPPLDFSSVNALTRSLRKNARGKHDGTVGHSWVWVVGPAYEIECGHTGQEGYDKMGYQEGVLQRLKTNHNDPIGYLWESLDDGSMQPGNGGFEPTLAVGRSVTKQQYEKLIAYVNSYPFKKYSLVGYQCTTFVTGALSVIGFELDARATIPIKQYQRVFLRRYRLWSDPRYCEIQVALPQVLEEKLVRAVEDGHFIDLTDQYPHFVVLRNRDKRQHPSAGPLASALVAVQTMPR